MLGMTESAKQKYPTILELHPGISCRLNCSFCYRNEKTYNSSYELISNDCLKKLIYEFAALDGQELYISGGLEPFSVYETVCHALLLAHNAGLKTRVYTNGTEPALQKGWVQELLVCTTAQIRFSVHARSVNTYSEITRINNAKMTFTLVRENILSLLGGKGEGGPLIGIGFVINEDNLTELIDAAEFWHDMGVDFFDLRFDATGKLSGKPEILKEIRNFQNLVYSGYFCPMSINVGSYAYKKPHFASRCFAPFEKIIVDPFGMVWCCCLQAQPGYRPSWAKLGDLKSQPLSEIVSGIKSRFPCQHCRYCTPWEAEYNLQQEITEISQIKVALTAT